MTTQQIVEKLREIEAAHGNSVSTYENDEGYYPCYDVDWEQRKAVADGLEVLREHFEHLMECTQWVQKEEEP